MFCVTSPFLTLSGEWKTNQTKPKQDKLVCSVSKKFVTAFFWLAYTGLHFFGLHWPGVVSSVCKRNRLLYLTETAVALWPILLQKVFQTQAKTKLNQNKPGLFCSDKFACSAFSWLHFFGLQIELGGSISKQVQISSSMLTEWPFCCVLISSLSTHSLQLFQRQKIQWKTDWDKLVERKNCNFFKDPQFA